MFTRLIQVISVLNIITIFSLNAAVIVGDSFDSNMDGWEARAIGGGTPYGTVSGGQTVGGVSGVMRILADSGDLGDEIYADIDDNELAGNKNYITMGVRSVTFKFYAGADDGGNGGGIDIPADLRLYFVSAGSIKWYYDIEPTAGWGGAYFGYGANFLPYSGWYTEDNRDQSYFLTDLTDVDEIGIEIVYQNWNGQVYGLDEFNLNDQPVPEPETYIILAFTLLSLGWIVARHKKEIFAFQRI